MKGRVVQGFFAAAGAAATAARGGGQAAQALDSSILRGTGPGARLPDSLRTEMERVFGASFADVRVHVGPQPERIGAVAFTAGADIFFAPGRYQPETAAGRRLVGHELAHVVQQKSGRARAPATGVAILRDPALEAEADRMGEKAARLIAATEPRRPSPPRAAAKGGVAVQRMQWSGNSGGWAPQQGYQPQQGFQQQGFPSQQAFPQHHGYPPQQGYAPQQGYQPQYSQPNLFSSNNPFQQPNLTDYDKKRNEVADAIVKIETRRGWRKGDTKEVENEVYSQLKPFVDEYLEILKWRANKSALEINNRHKISFEKMQSALVRAIRNDDPGLALTAAIASGSWHIAPGDFRKNWKSFAVDAGKAADFLHDIGRNALNVFIGNAAKNIGTGKAWDYHLADDPLGRGLDTLGKSPELTPFSHSQSQVPFDDIFSGKATMNKQHEKLMAEGTFRHYKRLAEKAHIAGAKAQFDYFFKMANATSENIKNNWGYDVGKLSEWNFA